GYRDTASLEVGDDLPQVRDQERLAIDAGRDHRLDAGEFIEHPARSVEVHDALDVVDGVVVFEAPNRAHVTAQIAARGIIDEEAFRHLGNRQRLPTVARIDPLGLRPVAHDPVPLTFCNFRAIYEGPGFRRLTMGVITARVAMTSGFVWNPRP